MLVGMELLSPAGNLEKLRYAWAYGADAAYIGLSRFSLRAKADNFSGKDWEQVSRLKGRKKLYGTLNAALHDGDVDLLRASFGEIARYPFDAFIISEPGLVPILRKEFPAVALHLSTQANCLNSESAAFYRDCGFSRIILARELSLRDIARIRKAVPDVELEVFVHGAMCVAYSGRCMMSSWLSGRSSNSGECAQSCRWNYRVLEESERPGEYLPVVEGGNFTALLSSRDLCLIDHLGEIRDAGVDSVKIEGRMKSLYYTAVVTRAYRKALDRIEGKPVPDYAAYRADIDNVSHREYSTGFFFGRDRMDSPTKGSYERDYLFLGTVGEKQSDGSFLLDARNRISEGDTIEYIGPDITSITDSDFVLIGEDGACAPFAARERPARLRTSKPVEEGFIIRCPGGGHSSKGEL
jgi:U32 family peptidase